MDDYLPEHKDVLDDLLTAMPGVKAGKAFGYPAYKVGRRMFAFVGGRGAAMKLPAERVQQLVDMHEDMHPFQPVEGTVWREWVAVEPADPADYARYLDLFEESLAYVSE